MPDASSLRATRDALRITVEIEEARARIAKQRLAVYRSSTWGILSLVASTIKRQPLKAILLAFKIVRSFLASPGRRRAVAEARAHFAAKRYEETIQVIDALLERYPADPAALKLRREALGKMGELTAMLETVRRARAVTEIEQLRKSERVLEGRLREMDPNWLPHIPGPVERYEPVPGRVLHLLKHSQPEHTNGYTSRSRYTMDAQRRAGLDPVAMTSLGQPRLDGITEFDPVIEVDGIEHHRLDLGDLPYNALPPDEFLELYAWTAVEKVRQLRPAVIHARSGFRGYEIPLVGLALAKHFDIPLVYEASMFLEGTWTDDLNWMEKGELYHLRTGQENRCMRDADQVVTIAESMRAEIVARDIDPDRVSVVPNGVEPERFQPREPDQNLKASLGLEGLTVLGYVSNVGFREGFDVMVRGIAELISRGEPVGGLVVGDGPELPKVKALAEELGVADRIAITGRVPHEQVAEYYALIDLFVIPRRDERASRLVTPLKPYEAMALGKPLLVAALPALLEVAEPPARGGSFIAEDPVSMADAATPFIRDPQMRAQVGAEARRWVLSERTWDHVGPMYAEVYRKAADHHRARHIEASRPPDESAEELEADIQQLAQRIAKARSSASDAEDRFQKDPMRKVRRVVRQVTSAKGLLGKARASLRVVRKARAQRGVEPDPTPWQRGANRRTIALPTVGETGDSGVLAEVRRSLATLPRDPEVRPSALIYGPLVRNNPYQALLYSRCFDHGIAPIGITELDLAIEAEALPNLGIDTWFHIHWTNQVLRGAPSKDQAKERLVEFEAMLDRLVGAGVRIAYTVHNVLPHEHEYPQLEAKVVQAILDRAALVHVLTEDSPAIVQPTIELPLEKTVHIPHPSYLGVYPEHLSQLQARYELGLTASDTVLAVLGGIRAYKGIGPLLDAFIDASSQDETLHLIVAGKPIDFPEAKALKARCEAHPRITPHFGRVPEDRLQLYARSADAIVLSHEGVLNSGVLALSMTFGRPVIAAARGTFPKLVTPDIGVLFEPDSHEALVQALLRAKDLKDPAYRQASRKRAEEIAPDLVAESFALTLRERF